MWPFTLHTPKPLLSLINTTILEYTLNQLLEIPEIEEVIIVIGFLKEQIINKIGNSYGRLSIKYVTQENANGTGDAIMCCKDYIHDRFLVLNGDDLYTASDIMRCLRFDYCIATIEVADPSLWGIVTENNGLVESIIEKPINSPSRKANIGLYVFDKNIFKHELIKTERGEYEIIDYIQHLLTSGFFVNCITVSENSWLPIGNPWQYLDACQYLLERITPEIKGTVESNASLNGPVYLGNNSTIKSFSYIEGPVYIGDNCTIAPGTHLRPGTIIMDGSHVGGEITKSLIMKNVKAKHQCDIGNSIIGNNCNIGAGTITADLRNDDKNHITVIKGKKVDTQKRKLGAFLGDEVKTGIGTLIYPGRKIWPKKCTAPGEIVKVDIMQ